MRRLVALGLVVSTALFFIVANRLGATPTNLPETLPPLQPHPLPPTLVQWHDSTKRGDYFDQVQPSPLGYLVWLQFPVKVYVEPLADASDSSMGAEKAKKWLEAVLQAVQEWEVYLPLAVVDQPDEADVKILRSPPPLQASFNRRTGEFQLSRVRAAETRYQFYIRQVPHNSKTIAHRITIQLSPNQAPDYIQATARHELGHALGIWGHSPLETDTMYFSQVRYPPPISPRDINTLKRVYEQPTRLGWPF